MPYLGNVPAEAYSQVSYQDLTGGSGTSFTLDYPVGSAGEIEVFVNNVRQEPTVAYTVNGTALTMTGSIAATDDFYVVFQGKAQQTIGIPEKQTDGTYLFGDSVTIDADGSTVLTVDRATSDGTIIDVQKDGTTVGSIGTVASEVYIGNGDTGLYFASGNNDIRPFNTSTQNSVDNSIDLGRSATRFKDLYLSGGVYLGGTGSANYLDDYEEGSWTPGIAGTTSGTKTMGSNNVGRYTKIGQVVTVSATIDVSGTETISGLVQITGLPFASKNANQFRCAASIGAQILCNLGGASKRLAAVLDHNLSYMWLMEQDDDTATYSHTPPIANSGAIYGITLTYMTDA